MAYRPDDTYNTSLHNINQGQNMQMAELTDKQKKFIDQKKFPLQEGLISPGSVYETITNPDLGVYDTGIFGIGAQEPTTKDEYNEYLKSIGISGQVSSLDDEAPYDFSGIAGQTAMIPGLIDPFSIFMMTKAGLGKKEIVSYLARKEAQQGIFKDIETKKAAAAAEEKAAADRKAQQQATIAANREAAKKFGDKPQPIYHQETKSQDRGGRDIGSRVSDSYEKQQSAQYGMLAKGGLVNFFKYGGFLG